MKRRLLKAFIGIGMVGIGLAQASLFAAQSEWIPTSLGILFSLLGVVYLWTEIYLPAQ